MATVAVAPAYRPGGDPVTAMVTGKLATPLLVVAMTPTVDTVPKTGWRAPVGVIWACSPGLIEARSAEDTDVATVHAPVEMTTTCALEAVAALPPAAPPPAALPLLPLLPLEPEPDVVPPPLTWSPTVTLTAATVPSIGEVRVALASAVRAVASRALAAAT